MLEHLLNPHAALAKLKTLLKPGGTITVIEGDHGSAYFHPDSDAAHDAIRAGLISAERFDAGIRALYRTAERDGVFSYTFFKASASRASSEP